MNRIAVFFLFIAAVQPGPAMPGSINNNASSSLDSSDRINCDFRQPALKQCTPATRNYILDNCFVVVNDNEVASTQQETFDCTWQSCRGVSLVGKLPTAKRLPDNRFEVDEYGIKQIFIDSPNCDSSGRCMPRAGARTVNGAFPRTYMTLRDAIGNFNYNSNAKSNRAELSEIQPLLAPSIVANNPYMSCAMSHRFYVYIEYTTVKNNTAATTTFSEVKDNLPLGGEWISGTSHWADNAGLCNQMIKRFVDKNRTLDGYKDGLLGVSPFFRSKTNSAANPGVASPNDVTSARCIQQNEYGYKSVVTTWSAGTRIKYYPKLTATRCQPNRDDPNFCTSRITLQGAPPNSCVYIFSFSNALQVFGCAESFASDAPWIRTDKPEAYQFYLAPTSNPFQVLAEVDIEMAATSSRAVNIVPELAASDCRPNKAEPTLCTTTISWKNAPYDSCVFVVGANGTQIMGCPGVAGSTEAPWVPWSNPGATRFLLADRNNPSKVYASVSPKPYTGP